MAKLNDLKWVQLVSQHGLRRLFYGKGLVGQNSMSVAFF
jgi:hypothetical protein